MALQQRSITRKTTTMPRVCTRASVLKFVSVAAASFAAVLAVLVATPPLQKEIVFLHRLNWPPATWALPARPIEVGGAAFSRFFGLHGGLANATAAWVDGAAGPLGAWRAARADDCAGRPARVVLYLHGNGENRAWAPALRKVEALRRRPFCSDVVTFDYRGFGDSPGDPTEAGLLEDAAAVYAWLRKQEKKTELVLYGHSLGSVVALRLAARLCGTGKPAPPRALVVEGALSSGVDVVVSFLPFLAPARGALAAALAYGFDALPAAAAIPAKCVPKVFQFHGARDRTCGVALGRKVAAALAAARGAKRTAFVEVPGAGHETAFDDGALRAELARFLDN